MSDDDVEAYRKVVRELDDGFRDDALWTKAVFDAMGDKDIAQAYYIRLRTEYLEYLEAKSVDTKQAVEAEPAEEPELETKLEPEPEAEDHDDEDERESTHLEFEEVETHAGFPAIRLLAFIVILAGAASYFIYFANPEETRGEPQSASSEEETFAAITPELSESPDLPNLPQLPLPGLSLVAESGASPETSDAGPAPLVTEPQNIILVGLGTTQVIVREVANRDNVLYRGEITVGQNIPLEMGGEIEIVATQIENVQIKKEDGSFVTPDAVGLGKFFIK